MGATTHQVLFLLTAFFLAGLVQTMWLKLSVASRWAVPIDRGRTFRGRRWFGDNKTWRGFLMMPLAVAVAFVVVASAPRLVGREGGSPWHCTGLEVFLLGAWTGFGYMVGELPNSFLKRQWDVPPGKPPTSTMGRRLAFVADQADSVLGALAALWVVVPISFVTCFVLLLIGPFVHWLFNVLLFLFGVKSRAA